MKNEIRNDDDCNDNDNNHKCHLISSRPSKLSISCHKIQILLNGGVVSQKNNNDYCYQIISNSCSCMV